jgi:hypothetical protein
MSMLILLAVMALSCLTLARTHTRQLETRTVAGRLIIRMNATYPESSPCFLTIVNGYDVGIEYYKPHIHGALLVCKVYTTGREEVLSYKEYLLKSSWVKEIWKLAPYNSDYPSW